jgi:predicted nucleotidyltransferase
MRNVKGLSKIRIVLKRYKAALEKDNFPVKALILFGSYARGNFRRYSDIDVCVISEKFASNQDYYETFLWKKTLEVDPRIEPIGFHPRDLKSIDPLLHEIKKNGIVVA